MKVYIDRKVKCYIEDFYQNSLMIHPTLDEATVLKKVNRLYEALNDLKILGKIYPLARLKRDWQEKGYREFICEDFHFAYLIGVLDDGTDAIWVKEVCHSLMYHE